MKATGYVQVYTGNGKGKTTAALGLALRAAGWGYRTYIAQFMKKGGYGEIKIIRRQLKEWITIEQFGLPGFHHQGETLRSGEREMAVKGLQAAEKALLSGDYRLVVLDEVNTLLHFQIVSPQEVLRLLDIRPEPVELILTGRYAPETILDRADLITEMRELRHYYTRDLSARKGIEH